MASKTSQPKIIVLDDDPTGSQTVHSCLLLLQWDVETLKMGLLDESPIFFVLTNTRSLPPEAAATVTTEVCHNLKQALAETQVDNFLLVSRSDSTLRGHYPIETDIIAEQLGPFDAHFLTPHFFEAGRVTINGTHYIQSVTSSGIQRTPTHETEFAKDAVFGYSTSYLPDYVAEKTHGKIAARQVQPLTLADVRSGCLAKLIRLENNTCVCVDGEQQEDLNRFAKDITLATTQGKKFLFRSAASLLTALSQLPSQPTKPEEMSRVARAGAGIVIVGSHVQKTTEQLEQLLKLPDVVGIELDVNTVQQTLDTGSSSQLADILQNIEKAHRENKTSVVFTSREELIFESIQERLSFGQAVSALLIQIVQNLPPDIGFLISKGGITSNDTLSKGLTLRSVRLLGQVIPGVSIVTTADTHPQFACLPVVLFPGNVGDRNALVIAYQRLSRTAESSA